MARVLENLSTYDAKDPAWQALEQEARRSSRDNQFLIEEAAPSGTASHNTLASRRGGLRREALEIGATAVEAPRH